GSGKFGLPPEMITVVDSLTAFKNPMIVIAMGSPYVLGGLPGAEAYLCSYSDAEMSTEATVETLFGEIPAAGKLPVTIPEMFAYGSGVDLPQSVLRRESPEAAGFLRDSLSRIDSIMNRAIVERAFPGG